MKFTQQRLKAIWIGASFLFLVAALVVSYLKVTDLNPGKAAGGVKAPLIVLDFDGVLCDSFEARMEALNSIAPEYEFQKAARSDYDYLKSLTPLDFFKHLGVPMSKLPAIKRELRLALQPKIAGLPVCAQARYLVSELKSLGYSVCLLTESSKSSINTFLKNNGMSQDFELTYTDAILFDKAYYLKKIMKATNLSAQQIIFVGDEIEDIEAAKEQQMHSISVNWGYQDKELLKKASPDFMIENQTDLIDAIGTIKAL